MALTRLPAILPAVLAAGLFCVAAAQPALAQTSPKSYTIIDLGRLDGDLTGGFAGARANSINASGKDRRLVLQG